MAYTSSTLSLGFDLIGGKYRVWHYTNPDPFSTVLGTDYFAKAYDMGVREGDLIFCTENDTDPPTTTFAYFSEVDADGNGTVTALAYSGAATFTNLTATGNVRLGDAAADLVGFYNSTGISQRASSVMATTNLASSSDFGATQLAWAQEITNVINGLGLHKGSA